MTLPFAKLSFPEMYEQELAAPLFQPWVDALLDAAQVTAGAHLMDVACGTGIVARIAAKRVGPAGRVVGVDLSPAMLVVARRVAPEIEFREGDGATLVLPDGERFDVVTCQQGLQFFPDRLAGVRSMRAALKPGGRLAIATWRAESEVPVGMELRRVAERHVGAIDDRRHSFGEGRELEALLRTAGFAHVRNDVIRKTIRFDDGNRFVRLNAMALVNMSVRGKGMSDAEKEAAVGTILRESADVVRRNTDAAGFAFELSTNLAIAS